MHKRPILRGLSALLFAIAATAGAAIFTLPASQAQTQFPAISEDENAATLSSLKPRKRSRPVIAIIGTNSGTETTDYLIPYGVLKRADVADVFALGMSTGPISMMPALTVTPNRTVASFDAQFPDGADYVIVPAMHKDDDPAVIAWIKAQATKGAMIIGICEGARIVGNAGLLNGRRATTHWYAVDRLRKRHPAMTYVPDRRFVVDGRIATTTGVSASIPMSLTLVEAIAGQAKAQQIADDLGVETWDARHRSNAFKLTRNFALSAAGNTLAFWNHEKLGLSLQPATDEVALALTADAWSRTYKSKALAISADGKAVTTRFGLTVLPDAKRADWKSGKLLPPLSHDLAAKALDQSLAGIAERYGKKTAAFVALQLEYPFNTQR